MDRTRKRTVAIGAVVALAVAGGGAAYAASNANDQRDALLRDAAQRLNVSPDQLSSALEGAFGDQLDQAVKDGRLTQAQADRVKQQIREHGVPLGGPGGPGGPGMGFEMHGGPLGPGLDAAAGYLGLTRAELGRQLMNGRSLADVAKTQGKAVDGIEQALVDAAKSDLDRAVTDGKLTAAHRDDMLRELQEHVGDIVNGTGPRGHVEFRRGGPGPGGPGGPPPPWGGTTP